MYIPKKKFVVDMCIIFITCIMVLVNNTINTSKIVAIVVLMISCVNLIRGYRNWYTFIIFGFILWCNYSICIANLLNPIQDFFTGWRENVDVIVPAMNILLIFTSTVAVLSGKENGEELYKKPFWKGNPHNAVSVYGTAGVLLLIMVFGFSRPEQSGVRGSSSSIYEYSLILFILAYYYTHTKIEKIILTILLVGYVMQDLLYGGRATALQLIICWFLIFMSHKVQQKRMLPFVVLAIIIFSGIGALRANFVFNISAIKDTLQNIFSQKFTLDTAYSAFYTSGTFLKVETIVSVKDRIGLFIAFLLSMIFGGSKIENSNLGAYTHDYYMHYYGGVLPYYAHFYLGIIGVILIGIYVSFLIRNTCCNNKSMVNDGLIKCIRIYIVSSVPRWYLYSPSSLIRGMVIIVVIYYAYFLFDQVIKRKSIG